MLDNTIYFIIIIIIVAIIIIIVYIYFVYKQNLIPGEIVELNNNNKSELNSKLKKFEEKLSHDYPLGYDYFKITHGENYYAFFERLGVIHMNLLIDNNEIVGSGSGILRNIKYKNDKILPTFYLCDLKIDPKYRGKHIPFQMLLSAKQKLNISNRIYGITMNKNDNKENKVVKLSKKIPLLNFKSGGKLMIYSIDYDTLLKIKPIIEHHRGNISFLSLLNIKDLILKSTGSPLPLLHIQWQSNDINNIIEPIPGYTYMFCCHIDDPLYIDLINHNIITNTTAEIIHHNMDDVDWKFILTSDI